MNEKILYITDTQRLFDDREYTVITEQRGNAYVTSVYISGYNYAGEIETARTNCTDLAEDQHLSFVAMYS